MESETLGNAFVSKMYIAYPEDRYVFVVGTGSSAYDTVSLGRARMLEGYYSYDYGSC